MTFPTKEDISRFRDLVSSKETIDYKEFKSAIESAKIPLKSTSNFFSKFPRLTDNVVSSEMVSDGVEKFLAKTAILDSLRFFAEKDPDFLFINELQDWLYSLSYFLNLEIPERYLVLWVMLSARTIMIFFGHQGKVRCTDLVFPPSPQSKKIMDQLWDLRQPIQLKPYDTNLFCRFKAVQFYELFAAFDLLAPENEGVCFCGGYLNLEFARRITGLFGYRLAFDDFVLIMVAWENRFSKSGVKFFWELMDETGKGFLDVHDLIPFARGILDAFQPLAVTGSYDPRSTVPSEEAFALELLDIMPESSGKRITFEQALKYPESFGLVIGALCHTESFYQYEIRDDNAQQRALAKLELEFKQRRNGLYRLGVSNESLSLLQNIKRVSQSVSCIASLVSLKQSLPGLKVNVEDTRNDLWAVDFVNSLSEDNLGSFELQVSSNEQTYSGQSMEPTMSIFYAREKELWSQQEFIIRKAVLGITDQDLRSSIRE